MKIRYFVDVDGDVQWVWKKSGNYIEYSYRNRSWKKSVYTTLKNLKGSAEGFREITPEELALLWS